MNVSFQTAGSTLETAPKPSLSASNQAVLSSFSDELSAVIESTLKKYGIQASGISISVDPPPTNSQPSQNVVTNTPITPFTSSAQPASTPVSAPAPPAASQHHWYADDAVDDAYWAKQPAAVQQLREIDDKEQRTALAQQLAKQGYNIDVPIMVFGEDAGKITAIRQQYGYTWVPSALQQNIAAAPGLSFGGSTPYDPNHAPPGSIMVG